MRTWRATAPHVELWDDIRASADLPEVKPKHEMTLDGNEKEKEVAQGYVGKKELNKIASGTPITKRVS